LKGKIKYQFTATIWQYSSPKGGWYFVSLPIEISNEIRENLKWQEEGWGRLKTVAKINNTEWETAIWFDTKMKTYLLPVKAEIRRKEKLEVEKNVNTIIWI
jgi:hypothetical protein